MARQIEAYGLELFGQALGGLPIVARHDARLWQVIPRLAKQRHLIRGFLFVDCGGIADQPVQRLPDAAAVVVQLVERSGAGQHFERTFPHPFQINPPRQIKKRGKGLVHTVNLAAFGDQLHRLHPDVFQRAQSIDQRALDHLERRITAVHTRRHPGQFQPFADLFEIDRQLVGQMDITVHHASHEFDRMVRLEPCGLIADHRIGGGVGFVETIVGEFFQKVENLRRLFLVDPVGHRTLFELGAFLGHFLGDLFTHRTAQQVSAAKAIARHDLRDLHNLFLVDDDALRFLEDVVNRGMHGFPFALAVLDLAIDRNILHRAGPVQRDQGDDVFDTGRLHPFERIHHAAGFHLKHRHRLGAGIKLVRGLVVQRDGGDIVDQPLGRLEQLCPVGGHMQVTARGFDLVYRVLDDGQGLEAQKVELDQTGLFDPFHVELRRGHIGARVLIKRHQRVQRPVPDHNPRRVGRCVAQQPLDLLAIVQQPRDDFLVLGLLAQARFICQRLFDADRFHALDGDHLG